MRTPFDPEYVAQRTREGTPTEAVIRAWTESGKNPDWHRATRKVVKEAMPLLAAALERLVEENAER